MLPRRFPTPLWIGAATLLVYGVTLNHWVSLSNIGAIAREAGWTWQPELRQPLTCVVLYPFRILPEAWLPFSLNPFAAIFAALVLACLSRSIALLSASIKELGRGVLTAPLLARFASAAPPCIAAAVCGLQLGFWEHATSFSGEMFDLLLFAYVIRCLLEFRNDQRESWLFRSAFVYAAGMTNDWAMIGYFPLYVLAVLFLKNFGLKRITKIPPPRQPRAFPRWLRNLFAKIGIPQNAMSKPVYPKFRPVVFDGAFFARMILCGLTGLSLYLLLPLIQSLSPDSAIRFWPALKANLRTQLNFLGVLRSPSFRLLALASLLPLLVMIIGLRSKSPNSGYETRRAIFLNRLAAVPLHAFVLLLALWLAFDPAFSPRHLSARLPMLSYYYLNAIIIGYCFGYFLQVAAESEWKLSAKFLPAAIVMSAVVVPLLMLARNFSQLRLTNSRQVQQFAQDIYEDLPMGKSVVLGTDLVQLSLLRAELAANGNAKDVLIVELPSLGVAQYHVRMARKYGTRWPVTPPTNNVDLVGPIKLLKLVSATAKHEPVFYLEPTFGALFDRPNDSVNGFVQHFASSAGASDLSNESVWQRRWTNHVQSLTANVKTESKHGPKWLRPFLRTLRLQTEPNATVFYLATVYSKSLNNWGVEAQRRDRWAEAGVWFRRSLELNPGNLSAYINSAFNEQWQRGDKTRLNPAAVQKQFAEVFGRHNDWRDILSNCGRVDEPTFLFRTGRAFLANGNIRLASNAFKRSADLAADWPVPRLWLAHSLNELGNYTEALNVTDHFPNGLADEGIVRAQFLRCRVTSLQGAGRTNEIPAFVGEFVRQNGQHREVLVAAATAYAENDMHEQQLATVDELLKREPNRSEWLSQKGLAELQLGRYEAAIATLSSALTLAPTDENARLSRAVARLAADQLDAAREDYQQLLNSKTCSANALFGLGTIAWRKHETNTAIGFYQQYLTNAIPRSSQASVAGQRLKELGVR
jgi:tetratricopeptide (TPR) repeat protein